MTTRRSADAGFHRSERNEVRELIYGEEWRDLSLEARDWYVVLAIDAKDGVVDLVSERSYSAETGVSRKTLAKWIGELEKVGFVRRIEDKGCRLRITGPNLESPTKEERQALEAEAEEIRSEVRERFGELIEEREQWLRSSTWKKCDDVIIAAVLDGEISESDVDDVVERWSFTDNTDAVPTLRDAIDAVKQPREVVS